MHPILMKISRSKVLEVSMIFAFAFYASFIMISNFQLFQTPRHNWVSQDPHFKPLRDLLDFGEQSKPSRRPAPRNDIVIEVPGTVAPISLHPIMAPVKETEPIKICAKTLGSLTKYSKWFRERYDPSVKLFMDKDDMGNYSAYGKRGLPFGFKGQNHSVFDQILSHENFTNPSIHGAARKSGCIRCAVIGSGGILNGSNAGQEIDGHDFIFRLNKATSKGRFERDVGLRTTFYTFFPESQQLSVVEDRNLIAFFGMFKSYDVEYALKTVQQDKSPRYTTSKDSKGMKRPGIHPSKLKIIHPGFIYYVSEAYLNKKKRPTTGSIVVILALHICDEVTIYGFGYNSRFTLHYYDAQFISHTNKSTGSHDVDNERDLWGKLHDEGVIRFFKRDL